MLLQTNSYIVPRDKRVEHARLLRRFRQTLLRLGCDHFEVYEQVGPNWNTAETTGRYVQIMRFRDRKHQMEVQAAERTDKTAQALVQEFCELVNFSYQQQQGLFAVGFYTSFLRMPTQTGSGAAQGQAEPGHVEQAQAEQEHAQEAQVELSDVEYMHADAVPAEEGSEVEAPAMGTPREHASGEEVPVDAEHAEYVEVPMETEEPGAATEEYDPLDDLMGPLKETDSAGGVDEGIHAEDAGEGNGQSKQSGEAEVPKKRSPLFADRVAGGNEPRGHGVLSMPGLSDQPQAPLGTDNPHEVDMNDQSPLGLDDPNLLQDLIPFNDDDLGLAEPAPNEKEGFRAEDFIDPEDRAASSKA